MSSKTERIVFTELAEDFLFFAEQFEQSRMQLTKLGEVLSGKKNSSILFASSQNYFFEEQPRQAIKKAGKIRREKENFVVRDRTSFQKTSVLFLRPEKTTLQKFPETSAAKIDSTIDKP